MRLQNSNKKTKLAWVIGVSVIILTTGGLLILNQRPSQHNDAQKNAPELPTSTQKEQSVMAAYDDPSAKQTGVDNIKTSDQTGASAAFPTTQPNLTLRIKSITQSDKTLRVSIEIKPSIRSGTCTLRISRNGVTLLEKSLEASNSSCSNFEVGTASLEAGPIDVTALVRVGDNVANSTQLFQLK